MQPRSYQAMRIKGIILAGALCAACNTFGISVLNHFTDGAPGEIVSSPGADFQGWLYESGPQFIDGAGIRLADGLTIGAINFTAENAVSEFQVTALFGEAGMSMTLFGYDLEGNLLGAVNSLSRLTSIDGLIADPFIGFGSRGSRPLLGRVEITANAPFAIDHLVYKDFLTMEAEIIPTPDGGHTLALSLIGFGALIGLSRYHGK